MYSAEYFRYCVQTSKPKLHVVLLCPISQLKVHFYLFQPSELIRQTQQIMSYSRNSYFEG